MKKKLLIIDKTNQLGFFLKTKLNPYGIDVLVAKNGLDGLIKMRNELPDLVILDYELSKMKIEDFLNEKQSLKTTKNIPIILLYSKSALFNKQIIINLSKYKLYKLILKPVEIDQLLKQLEGIFMKKFEIDSTDCYLDIHLNEDFLFVEISRGINLDKLELMKLRIFEIKQRTLCKKIIIIITDVEYNNSLYERLDILLKCIIISSGLPITDINILTNISYIKDFYNNHPKYKQIDMMKSKEMVFEKIYNYNNVSNQNIEEQEETSVNLQFYNEKKEGKINMEKSNEEDFNIAVIDDDLRVLEFMEIILLRKNWKVNLYVDAMLFIESLEQMKPDLIFSDIMMPTLSGFELIEYLNIRNSNIPFIIISATYNKNFLLKANNLGVANFIVKPLKPDVIIKKAEEYYLKKLIKNKEIKLNNSNIDRKLQV